MNGAIAKSVLVPIVEFRGTIRRIGLSARGALSNRICPLINRAAPRFLTASFRRL